jgi:5-methylcytosine-specific restriction endonuclease McrA
VASRVGDRTVYDTRVIIVPRATAALAKNTIRRALRAIGDAEPSRASVGELWAHFEARCAYCGRDVDRAARLAHLDHLVPTSSGGSNHISNRVLACARCNGDEKREEVWSTYLRRKVTDRVAHRKRRRKIEEWIAAKAMADRDQVSDAVLGREIDRAIAAFDLAVRRLRGHVAAGMKRSRVRAVQVTKKSKRRKLKASGKPLAKRGTDFWSLDKLRAMGFRGGSTVGQLRASMDVVPRVRGVYLVVRKSSKAPVFLNTSRGGRFASRNPTVAVDVLKARWLSASRVLYIGKAGASDQATTLRGRLRSYVEFGSGKPAAHWGGRYVWQLADASDLCIYWKATRGHEPAEFESELLALFHRAHDQLPFANLRR